jgi:hypothetical protein
MDGTEPTFDGQKMPPGIHFRWTFAPELGFPPGGFWLCRRPAAGPEKCIDPPEGMVWDRDVNPCPPPGGAPGWGDPDFEGWRVWSVPFVLPVTVATWPTRYPGAPNPFAPQAADSDVQEALRRLGGLKLDAALSDAQILAHLRDLRAQLAALVSVYPSRTLFDVPVGPAAEGDAPRLGLRVMQKLLLLALNPYMARVLGLYYVDADVAGGKGCVFSLVGRWGEARCATRVVFPGSASPKDLAAGSARVGGLALGSNPKVARLGGWGAGAPLPGYPLSFEQVLAGMDPPTVKLLVAESLLRAILHVPVEVCRITLDGAAEIDVQVAGSGTVSALGGGRVLDTQAIGSNALRTVTFRASRPDLEPIDTLTFASAGTVVVGALGLRLRPAGPIGTLWAVFNPPKKDTPPEAPAAPAATVRFRQAEVVAGAGAPVLQPRSQVEVHWPAPLPLPTDDPLANPPPPNRPLGFLAERADAAAGPPVRLPRLITPSPQPTPVDSPLTPKPARSFRVMDLNVPDPKGALTYRVAGFDSFGVLGAFSPPSAPLVVAPRAPLPTSVRLLRFDNAAASGGQPVAGGWSGGLLRAEVLWSGPALVSSPDARSWRLTVAALDAPSPGLPLNQDQPLPAPQVLAFTVVALPVEPGQVVVHVRTNPALPALPADDPPALLVLSGQSPATGAPLVERYAVRPAPVPGLGVVATLYFYRPKPSSPVTARLIVNPGTFVNQPAYLVLGLRLKVDEAVPLLVPLERPKVRGRVAAVSSTAVTFAWPAGLPQPDDPQFPPAAQATFVAPQRRAPPVPPQPPVPTPTHTVHHEYFDPADFYGRARRALPFARPAQTGVKGYNQLRASVDSLILADVKRRQATPDRLLDPSPAVTDPGGPRADLAQWIQQLGEWLSVLNARRAALHAPAPVTPLTADTVLADPEGRRALVEHFYYGLLDDELRALADVAAPGDNRAAFARVNGTPLPPDPAPPADVVDGKGDGRFLYKLQAVNEAGSASDLTRAAGPYYTRVVQPPHPPALARVQPLAGGVLVAWALDPGPDTAGYLVYRAGSPDALADLRYFGQPGPGGVTDPTRVARLNYLPKAWPALAFSAGDVDPRLVALVPEPRLIARDDEGSDMAEVTLAAGAAPTEVLGVYRAAEFDPGGDPLNQPRAFNYWRPPPGGIAQLVTGPGAPARLIGLRVGLGRAVPVVVVATVGGSTRALGALPARRAAFLDAGTAGHPAAAAALPGWAPPPAGAPLYYAVVAVDRFGNRSAPSAVGSAQPAQSA